ncbi:MAG: hypothetical protein ABJE95_15470 [Byssovorax sp.]
MRSSHSLGLAAILGPLTAVFVACSGGSRSSGSAAQGGAGGVGESVGTTTTGVGGQETIDAAAPDSAASCSGDVGAWSDLTGKEASCQSGADCCVIVSPCLSEAQIVGAAQRDEASSVWPYCDVACVDCIPPAIEVACVGGACLGRVVPAQAPDSPLRRDHCGTEIMKAIDFGGSTGVHFGCGG